MTSVSCLKIAVLAVYCITSLLLIFRVRNCLRVCTDTHYLAIEIAFCFFGLTIPISIFHTWEHLNYFVRPLLQSQIVRIIWMVPVFSTESLLSTIYVEYGYYFQAVREIYEAYVIYCFMRYLLHFMGDERYLMMKLSTLPSSMGFHKPPFCWLAPWQMGQEFLRRCKAGVFQFVVVRFTLTVFSVVMHVLGMYEEGNYSFRDFYIWTVVISCLSQTWALYTLFLFYHCTHKELVSIKPFNKFLSIKLVIFFSWWQALLVGILIELGHINSSHGHTAHEVAALVEDLLICIEMLVASVAFYFAFPVSDFDKYMRGRAQPESMSGLFVTEAPREGAVSHWLWQDLLSIFTWGAILHGANSASMQASDKSQKSGLMTSHRDDESDVENDGDDESEPLCSESSDLQIQNETDAEGSVSSSNAGNCGSDSGNNLAGLIISMSDTSTVNDMSMESVDLSDDVESGRASTRERVSSVPSGVPHSAVSVRVSPRPTSTSCVDRIDSAGNNSNNKIPRWGKSIGSECVPSSSASMKDFRTREGSTLIRSGIAVGKKGSSSFELSLTPSTDEKSKTHKSSSANKQPKDGRKRLPLPSYIDNISSTTSGGSRKSQAWSPRVYGLSPHSGRPKHLKKVQSRPLQREKSGQNAFSPRQPQGVFEALWTSTLPAELQEDLSDLGAQVVEGFVVQPYQYMRRVIKGTSGHS